jgi:hypothetical protein
MFFVDFVVFVLFLKEQTNKQTKKQTKNKQANKQ